MPSWMPIQKYCLKWDSMNLYEFTNLLKQHCQGNWWEKVTRFKPDPKWGNCECCTYHPLTEADAIKLNKLMDTIEGNGGPSPTSIYPHCSGDIFIEWHSSDNENSIVMDLNNPFGTDALVRLGKTPIYFVKIEPNLSGRTHVRLQKD